MGCAPLWRKEARPRKPLRGRGVRGGRGPPRPWIGAGWMTPRHSRAPPLYPSGWSDDAQTLIALFLRLLPSAALGGAGRVGPGWPDLGEGRADSLPRRATGIVGHSS